MKEITIQTREKIYNQYYGITVYRINKTMDNRMNYIDSFIELTPLKKITESDAITIAKMFGCVNAEIYKRNKECVLMIDDSYEIQISYNGYICVRKNKELYNEMVLRAYQYLQSKGYALPYLNYSVEDLVELGVYKLK